MLSCLHFTVSHAFQSRLFLQVPPCRSDCTLSSRWPKADAREGGGGERVEEGSDYSPHTSSFSSTPQKRRKFILKPYGTYRYAVSLGGAPEPSSTLRVCWGALRLASSPHLAVAQFPSQVSLSHFCQRVSFLACTTCAALRCRTQYPH